ncbi:MAG TPA: family 20 glycosylhydrolase, partial [Armatimonadota bacterium]
ETLYHMVDLFSEWKMNQIQLYTEHTFAYLAHPTVWKTASPMTGEEIMALDAYCRSKFIELVPNQNSFGHMGRWLEHEKYTSMAEAPKGCDTEWGFRAAFSLCPVDKRSIPFLRGLFDELLPHFTSSMFNAGCDETIDLGCGRSKKACEERGKGRVYLEFVQQIQRMVEEREKTMQFWGDIIVKHPELIPELPANMIALEWGYEYDHPFAEHGALFQESGVPFYVSPGTSTWNTLSGKTDNAVENIANAAKNGLKNGSIGLLNTDWGDNGHWQPLSVSYLGFLAGAMASWNAAADLKGRIAQSLSLHAFGDSTGAAGQAFHDLGNLYKAFSKRTINSAVPWHVLFRPTNESTVEDVKTEEFDEMSKLLSAAAEIFAGEKMTAKDAGIVRQEFDHLAKMLAVSAETGKEILQGGKPKNFNAKASVIKRRHERVWLLRNRSGGLSDSLARFGRI